MARQLLEEGAQLGPDAGGEETFKLGAACLAVFVLAHERQDLFGVWEAAIIPLAWKSYRQIRPCRF